MGLKFVRLGTRTTLSVLLGFQLAHGRFGAFSASTTCKLISCDKFLYMYINTIQACTHAYTHAHTNTHTSSLGLFLWRTLTDTRSNRKWIHSFHKKRHVVQRSAVNLTNLTSPVSGPGLTRSLPTHHVLGHHTMPLSCWSAHSPCQKITMGKDELKGPTGPGRACQVL